MLSFLSTRSFLSSQFYLIISKPLIESNAQVYMILSFALVMGGVFGFIFGVLDVEDSTSYQIKLALLREEHYCYPIGAFLGAIAGFMNEYIRLWEIENLSLAHAEFDDDI